MEGARPMRTHIAHFLRNLADTIDALAQRIGPFRF